MKMIVWALLMTSNAFAVERCTRDFARIVSEMLGGHGKFSLGYGTDIAYPHFAYSKKILLLGDSGKDEFAMGPLLTQKFPQKKVVSTDIKFRSMVTKNGFTKMRLNHRTKFPFKDNSFDTVILRRGLCICHDNRACAGFCPITEAKDFFEKVIRVLDKRNPNSIAILHGEARTDSEIQKIWKRDLTELEEKYPVHVQFVYTTDDTTLLNSIVIIPAAP